MSLDWETLIELRDRRRGQAAQAVARDREVAQAALAQAQAAHGRLEQEQQAKAGMWQALARPAGDTLSVDQLRQAGGWSRVLDGRIAQAGDAARRASSDFAERQDALAASHRRLQEAARGLEKAQELQRRDQREVQRLQERRQDEAADDAALAGWAARRGA